MMDLTRTQIHTATCKGCGKELTCQCGRRSAEHHCLECGERLKESLRSAASLLSPQFFSLIMVGYSLQCLAQLFGAGTSSKKKYTPPKLTVYGDLGRSTLGANRGRRHDNAHGRSHKT